MAKQPQRRTGRAGARTGGKPGSPGKRQPSTRKGRGATGGSQNAAGKADSASPEKFKPSGDFAKFKKREGKQLSPKRESFADDDQKHSHSKFRSDRKFSDMGHKNRFKKNAGGNKQPSNPDEVRLNRYLASAGIASRREADRLIQDGLVSINGKVVTQLGTKVQPGDVVRFGDEVVQTEKHMYVLLNKPKDYITTTKDTHNRKTVMNLVNNACKERIVPVGRLDRNTTGLLLFTNDGNLSKKLTHPRHRVHKIYHAHLDRGVSKPDLEKLVKGVELEDGPASAQVATWVGLGEDKRQVGLELTSGRNRVVRRMFEALGYKVVKLDRVVFAGLTKKDLPRGRWRFLTEREIGQLKAIR